MNKSQFNKYVCNALVKRLRNSNIAEANAVIDVFTEAVTEALAEGDEINLIGFGRFMKVRVEAREGHNPRTGKSITIPAFMRPKFRAGTRLKEACNRKEKI